MVDMTYPVLFTVMLNTFIVFLGGGLIGGGLIDNNQAQIGFQEKITSQSGGEITGASGQLQNATPGSDDLRSSEGSGFGDGIIGGINSVISFLIFLTNVILAPFSVFTMPGMPTTAKILVSVPLATVNVISYAAFIRAGA